MDHLGVRLRRAREQRGLSLREIADRTKISVTTLEALERGDLHRVPGGIFGRAFVRSYAAELGLEPEAIVAEFLARLEEHERTAAERGAVRPEITADDRQFLARQQRALRIMRVAVMFVVAGSVALLVWQIRAFFAGSEPPADSPRVTVAQPAADGPPVTPEPEGQSPVVPAASLPVAAPAAPPQLPPPMASASQPDPSQAVGPLVVEVTFSEASWLTVDADGKRVLTQQVRPGDRQRFEAEREILLDIGNAGSAVWTINGKPARPLGQPGAHARAHVTRLNLSEYLQ
jgi:cytoskeletal protein RodZ